jgi:UDPglucose 6-dehydrogenase
VEGVSQDKIERIYLYDIDPAKSLSTYIEAVTCEIVFICLPTPMIDKKGGDCDLSFIINFSNMLNYDLPGLFVIKSTVPIGTTKSIATKRKDLKIIHNPEFLTERNAVDDFKKGERHIIGGPEKLGILLKKFYEYYFDDNDCILVTSDESEAIKYFSNTFLSLKVSYFNLMFDLCKKSDLDFETVRKAVVMDKRIGESHSFVPGCDGDRGFGGTCLPKDLNALLSFMEAKKLNTSILKSVWEYNRKIRKLINW